MAGPANFSLELAAPGFGPGLKPLGQFVIRWAARRPTSSRAAKRGADRGRRRAARLRHAGPGAAAQRKNVRRVKYTSRMNAAAAGNFATEIRRLKDLYLVASYAFDHLAKEEEKRVTDRTEPLSAVVISQGAHNATFPDTAVWLRNLRSTLPRYLEEVVLVRVISALEVYLIDNVREIFAARRDLFHSAQRVEFHVSELLSADTVTDLWDKLVSRELRRLQNQGFAEIVSYYRTKLKIDFARSPVPMSYLMELHDRRHLLVHRLGKTDDEYRHRYNTAKKAVKMSKSEMLECFDKVVQLVQTVDELSQRARDERRLARRGAGAIVTARLIIATKDVASAVLQRDYLFVSGERLVRLSDIVQSRYVKDGNEVLFLRGTPDVINVFMEHLRSEEAASRIAVVEASTRLVKRQPSSGLPGEVLADIARALPPRPWPREIHKHIAKHFGLSNTKGSAALSEILEDPQLLTLAIRGAVADTA